MLRTYTTGAIVLRRIDLGEKDRILTVYTREAGKVSVVAKGSRRPGSKLSGATEPFTYCRMFLSRGRDLEVLSQAEIKESFPRLRTDMKAVAYAVYILELTHAFTDEREPNPDLFDTLLSVLYVLESGTDPEIAARYYELQMLSILGYEPHFDSCLRCGKPIGRERVAFSPALGGIVCMDCGPLPPDAIEVPGAATTYARALLNAEPHKLKDMKVPPGARRDLERMLKWHIRYRLENDLKSLDFIERLSVMESDGE